jgi:hypothetical protein
MTVRSGDETSRLEVRGRFHEHMEAKYRLP